MFFYFMTTAALVAVTAAVPVDLPDPGLFALILSEDCFEDYLDKWLENEAAKKKSTFVRDPDGCSLYVNGDLGQPQPVYLYHDHFPVPDENSGYLHFDTGAEVVIACTGLNNVISAPDVVSVVPVATATCVTDQVFSGAGWLSEDTAFGQLVCSSQSTHIAEITTETCYNNNIVIRIGFSINDKFYPLYFSCFDQNHLAVLYVKYEQNPGNSVPQSNVPRPKIWQVGPFYPGVAVDKMYTQVQQKVTIAGFVGPELAKKYITSTQYLARGHLAAKSDYIYATGQRATFYFINAAPQWQPFNAGNWNWLEQNLRIRIGIAGYNTVVYTGTFGITQLRNKNNTLVDIYLYHDDTGNAQIPVPLYFYKVVYDASRRIGTAFVGINNPYYTMEEVHTLTFCTDHCRNNQAFNWLSWQPDNIQLGYSFCCTIDDFRNTVPHLPPFTVDGLLF